MNITAWEKQLGLLWSLPRLAWFIIRAVIQELIHQRTESEHSSQISARLTSKKESSSHSSSLSRRLSFRQTNTRFLLTPSSHSFLPLLNRKNSHSKVLTRDSPFLEVSRIGHIVSQSFNRNKISETSEGSQLVVAIHASCFLGRLIANMHTSLLTKDVPGSSWHNKVQKDRIRDNISLVLVQDNGATSLKIEAQFSILLQKSPPFAQ